MCTWINLRYACGCHARKPWRVQACDGFAYYQPCTSTRRVHMTYEHGCDQHLGRFPHLHPPPRPASYWRELAQRQSEWNVIPMTREEFERRRAEKEAQGKGHGNATQQSGQGDDPQPIQLDASKQAKGVVQSPTQHGAKRPADSDGNAPERKKSQTS